MRKLATIMFLCLCACLSGGWMWMQQYQPVAASGVGPWTDTNTYLWAYNGSTNSAGNLIDLSGNGNIGVNYLGVIHRVTNALGVAEACNKYTLEATRYTQCTSNSLNGSGDYTIGLWMYLTSADSEYTIAVSDAGNHLVGIAWIGDVLYVRTYEGAYQDITVSFARPTNSWLYVAYSRASGQGKVYTNGIQAGTGSMQNVTLLDRALIGKSVWDYPMQGYVYRPYTMGHAQSSNSVFELWEKYKPTGAPGAQL